MHNISVFKEFLSSPKKVAITTHHKPDSDAMGSSLGLARFLEKWGHHVQVITPTDYADFLQWMPGNEKVLIFSEDTKEKVNVQFQNADIIFCLDFNNLNRINELGEMVRQSSAKTVLIDHHLQPEHFADFEYWTTKAAATAELIYELILELEMQQLLDTEIGECLYSGIMTDTGSFRHPSTTARVHEIAAELIKLGVNHSKVHRNVFDSYSPDRLKFLGYCLSEKMIVLPEYNTCYFYITKEELKKYNSQTGDTEGLVNYALALKGIRFAALMIDRTEMVKMSFRSVGDFDVNEFARKHFEGGGHKNAAGGKSNDSLENVVKKFQELIPQYKEQLTIIK
jgi:bifunctional oligoribonuclease and PAP phosphatase NrnA